MIATTVRVRKCDVCPKLFERRSTLHVVCSYACTVKRAKQKERAAKQAAKKAAADDRRDTRAKLEALKSLRELRSEAQAAFNAFIRYRDRLAGYGCICCGAPLDWNSSKPGGAVDAGHFISRGADIALAFDERNVNAQRKGCNRPNGTTRAKFTAGMTERWGVAVVEELEGPQSVQHLRHDDLRQIRDTYRRKANALKKQLETI